MDPARQPGHTDLELAQWRGWPDAGIGIVGGPVAAVDIDIADDAELAHRVALLARERLGDTPALRVGRPPKRLLVYRTATGSTPTWDSRILVPRPASNCSFTAPQLLAHRHSAPEFWGRRSH